MGALDITVRVLPAHALAPAHLERWSVLQRATPAYWSPFLSPDFTLAIAAGRPDTYVAILEHQGRTIGFFPHQRNRLAMGHPVGAWLNDLQGVVIDPEVAWDGHALVRACGLTVWRFSRLLASQRPFDAGHVRRDTSMFIDLSQGYERYAHEKRHVVGLARLARKARKLERDVGPLRFELHSADATRLETLMAWRLERYRSHGYHDLFAIPWARAVIRTIHATQAAHFGGVLSILSAGAEPVAAHLGIRWRDVWHSWVIGYAPRFARYSPGLILYLQMAQHAPTAGFSRIELGGGDYPYKRTLMNGSIEVAAGAVDRLAAMTTARRWCDAGAAVIRQSVVLRPPARAVLRTYRAVRHRVLYARAYGH